MTARSAVAFVIALVTVLAAACSDHHARAPSKPPEAGVSIAVYNHDGSSYGVVDDRRWVEVVGTELVLDRIDPGVALASLVIEPLGGAELAIGRCARPRIPVEIAPSPVVPSTIELRARHLGVRPAPLPKPASAPDKFDTTVRCTVAGAPGRHLVRILYVSTTLKYRAQHDVLVTALDRATVTSRFAIETPTWRDRADVTLYDGVPGSERPPSAVASGSITLDGSVAVLAVPGRDVGARLRRVFDGAVATPDLPASDAAWYAQSTHNVVVWLELPRLELTTGPVHVHLELATEGIRDVEVPVPARHDDDREAALRLPLWTDETLIGTRLRVPDPGESQLSERVMLSVANLGDAPREVWIEEHVRPARRRKIARAWPTKPSSGGDLVRSKLELKPRGIERVGYTIAYDF